MNWKESSIRSTHPSIKLMVCIDDCRDLNPAESKSVRIEKQAGGISFRKS